MFIAGGSTYPGDQFILVKNWTKNNDGTQVYPYLWWIETQNSTTEFEMVPLSGLPPADLTSAAGIPGQNTSTPGEKVFGFHAIVKYGSTYYDPSYGVTYTSEDDMESQAVHGFGGNARSGSNYFDIDVRDAATGGLVFQ